MADITSGRTRRLLSVGRLTASVGGSYLWQAIKRPFQSASRHERTLLETHIRNAERMVARSKELRALVGLDAYLKAFGTVRNWHRLFREIVERANGRA